MKPPWYQFFEGITDIKQGVINMEVGGRQLAETSLNASEIVARAEHNSTQASSNYYNELISKYSGSKDEYAVPELEGRSFGKIPKRKEMKTLFSNQNKAGAPPHLLNQGRSEDEKAKSDAEETKTNTEVKTASVTAKPLPVEPEKTFWDKWGTMFMIGGGLIIGGTVFYILNRRYRWL